MSKLIADAAEALGGLNGIVNNAGIIRDGMLVKKDRNTGEVKKLSMRKWQQVIDINLTGVFLGAREFVPGTWRTETRRRRRRRHRLHLVHQPLRKPRAVELLAAKAGIIAMTKLWGGELARFGIRTGAIAPGFTRTPILEGMPPEMLEKMKKPIPVRRIGEPEEMYMGVKFIIENDFFTSNVLDINGGQVL